MRARFDIDLLDVVDVDNRTIDRFQPHIAAVGGHRAQAHVAVGFGQSGVACRIRLDPAVRRTYVDFQRIDQTADAGVLRGETDRGTGNIDGRAIRIDQTGIGLQVNQAVAAIHVDQTQIAFGFPQRHARRCRRRQRTAALQIELDVLAARSARNTNRTVRCSHGQVAGDDLAEFRRTDACACQRGRAGQVAHDALQRKSTVAHHVEPSGIVTDELDIDALRSIQAVDEIVLLGPPPVFLRLVYLGVTIADQAAIGPP